jgi:predicted CoA-binding protein
VVSEVRQTLEQFTTWAVVGCSPDPRRDSHGVAAFLQARGKRVVPVNPNACPGEILGQECHPDLASIGEPVEVVDIFRRSEFAGAHVDEAIAIGAKAVWMQLGVIDEAAAVRAREAGLLVVMDRCPKIEWARA